MKFPESTLTTRSSGSRSSRAIDNVRGSMRPSPDSSAYGTSRQATSRAILSAMAGVRRPYPSAAGS